MAISSLRVKSEHAFGMICKRFAIYDKTLNLGQGLLESVVLSTIALHNYINKSFPNLDEEFCENQNQIIDDLDHSHANDLQTGNFIRDQLVLYINNQ